MKKPKPVTKEDRFCVVGHHTSECYCLDGDCLKVKKVKSAVEWLKEIDNKRRHLTIKDTLNEFKDLGRLIIVTEDELNKAFEGVMEDE